MSSKKFMAAKGRRSGGLFIAFPRVVLRAPELSSLSPYAAKLMLDLLGQLNVGEGGTSNNGDLAMAWRLMEKRNWRSRATLEKARDELLERDIIVLTRQGGRNRPSLFGFTFFAINECGGKLEMPPTKTPPKRWG